MLNLTDKLPQANYDKAINITKKNQSFPKINEIDAVKVKKKKMKTVIETDRNHIDYIERHEESKEARLRSPVRQPDQYDYLPMKKNIKNPSSRNSPSPEKIYERNNKENILPSIHRNGSMDLRYDYSNNRNHDSEVSRLNKNLLNEGNKIMRKN